MRKPVFGVFDQIQHKSGIAATEYGLRLETSDLGRRGIVSTIFIAKIKALISCAVTVQLSCGFVFAYAKRRFSHVAAQLIFHLSLLAYISEVLRIGVVTEYNKYLRK